jgi:hypothetical protein
MYRVQCCLANLWLFYRILAGFPSCIWSQFNLYHIAWTRRWLLQLGAGRLHIVLVPNGASSTSIPPMERRRPPLLTNTRSRLQSKIWFTYWLHPHHDAFFHPPGFWKVRPARLPQGSLMAVSRTKGHVLSNRSYSETPHQLG